MKNSEVDHWRDATAEDTRRKNSLPARFRNNESDDWQENMFLIGIKRGMWLSQHMAWRFCQVYDPPKMKYSEVELIKKYGRVIKEHVKALTEKRSKELFSNIQLACEFLNIGSYNWKNSSEGFENWVKRMYDEQNVHFPESAKNLLLSFWEELREIEDEFEAVYDSLLEN